MSFVVNKTLDLSAALGLYDWWASRNLRDVHDTLIELAKLRGDEVILDVGCGTGQLSSRLARVSKNVMVRGVDVGPRMITVAEKRLWKHHPNAKNIEYRVATAVRLPYSHAEFDVVSSCLLFHLLQNSEKEQALREIFRVLKPGGRYVCAEFERYPASFFCRNLLEYPTEIICRVGFHVDVELSGPSITRCRSIVYRALTRAAEEGDGQQLSPDDRVDYRKG